MTSIGPTTLGAMLPTNIGPTTLEAVADMMAPPRKRVTKRAKTTKAGAKKRTTKTAKTGAKRKTTKTGAAKKRTTPKKCTKCACGMY